MSWYAWYGTGIASGMLLAALLVAAGALVMRRKLRQQTLAVFGGADLAAQMREALDAQTVSNGGLAEQLLDQGDDHTAEHGT